MKKTSVNTLTITRRVVERDVPARWEASRRRMWRGLAGRGSSLEESRYC